MPRNWTAGRGRRWLWPGIVTSSAVLSILALPAITAAGASGKPVPRAVPAESSSDLAQLDNFSATLRADVEPLSIFTGLSVDTLGHLIRLFVTEPTNPQLVQVLTRHTRYPITVVQVPASQRQLLRRTSESGPAIDQLIAKGIPITRWGPQFETGLFEVGLRGVTPERESLVRAALGQDVVVRETATEPQQREGGRANDTVPWYGGDYGTDPEPGGNTCTTTFSLYSTGNGYDYAGSAGHCFASGVRVVVGTNGYATAPIGTHALIGTVSTSSYNTSTRGYLDASFIPLGSYKNDNYVWGPNDITHRVIGTLRLSPGNRACADGAFSGEACGQVDSKGYLQCHMLASGAKVCGIIEVFSTNGYPLVGNGDSGGPVYTGVYTNPPTSGADVQASGMITAFGDFVRCRYKDAGGRTCGKLLLYTDQLLMNEEFSVAIKTN